jgi:hypothetical protein
MQKGNTMRNKKPPPAARDQPRLIAEQKCSQCLFSTARIVESDRAAQIMKKVAKQGNFFACHKGTINGLTVVCHGSWLAHIPGHERRLAQAFGAVKFINADNLGEKKEVRLLKSTTLTAADPG